MTKETIGTVFKRDMIGARRSFMKWNRYAQQSQQKTCQKGQEKAQDDSSKRGSADDPEISLFHLVHQGLCHMDGAGENQSVVDDSVCEFPDHQPEQDDQSLSDFRFCLVHGFVASHGM